MKYEKLCKTYKFFFFILSLFTSNFFVNIKFTVHKEMYRNLFFFLQKCGAYFRAAHSNTS